TQGRPYRGDEGSGLELPPVPDQDQIIRERRVAVAARDREVGDAPLAVALDGEGDRQRDRVGPPRIAHRRLDRDRVSRTPEALAAADQIVDRHPFHASSQADAEPLPTDVRVAASRADEV